MKPDRKRKKGICRKKTIFQIFQFLIGETDRNDTAFSPSVSVAAKMKFFNDFVRKIIYSTINASFQEKHSFLINFITFPPVSDKKTGVFL